MIYTIYGVKVGYIVYIWYYILVINYNTCKLVDATCSKLDGNAPKRLHIELLVLRYAPG